MRTRTLASLLAAIFALGFGAALLQGAELPLPAQALPGPGLNTGSATRLAITDILPADSAFALQVLPEADHSLVLLWEMPAGYYLYRDSVKAETADGTAIALELPDATPVTDEYFGAVEVYYERLLARIAPEQLPTAPGATFELQLSYQGCAEELYCYPPQQKALQVVLPE